MGRPKKTASNSLTQINLTESFTSLFLGALVVLVATFLVFAFAKNKTYDKINTAISTFQQPQKTTQTRDMQTVKTYEVKARDNLWTIAEKVYGSGYNWVDLAKANKLGNPSLIFAGNKLIVPVVEKIAVVSVKPVQNNSPSISGVTYKVVESDNLWDISVRKYGDGYKWPEIAKVNKIPNPDLIYPDSVLKLPR